MRPTEWPERAWEWIKRQFKPQLRKHDRIQRPKDSGHDLRDQPGRYEVKDHHGQLVDRTGSLGRALKSWKDQTGQRGTITDTKTGEDVTPNPDDDGRYVVFDAQGNQLRTFDNKLGAFQAWEEETHKNGSVIDTVTQKDITPFTAYLSDEELAEVMALVRGDGWTHDFIDGENYIDVDEVERLIPLVNRRELKIFKLGNVQGKGFSVPTKTVKVTKRRSVVERVPRDEWRNVPLRPIPTKWERTVEPKDDFEHRPIEDVSEITRLNPALLVHPLFDRRLAERDLPIRQYVDEAEGEVPTKRMKFRVIDERIVPEEWEEEIPVTNETRVQLLHDLVDLSFSMGGGSVELAAAISIVLVSKHLNDDSKYFFSWFANDVDERQKGTNKRQKEALIKFILTGEAVDEIGGGTRILRAIQEGARTVRRQGRRGDIPELLIITDGGDNVTAEEIFDAIGTEVVLHVIIVNSTNHSLARHATTYDEVTSYEFDAA